MQIAVSVSFRSIWRLLRREAQLPYLLDFFVDVEDLNQGEHQLLDVYRSCQLALWAVEGRGREPQGHLCGDRLEVVLDVASQLLEVSHGCVASGRSVGREVL